MQGLLSVIKLRLGYPPPLKVTQFVIASSSPPSENLYIKYKMGNNRSLCFNIIQIMSKGDVVHVVQLKLSEENDKASSVKLNLEVIRSGRYGVVCNLSTNFKGSFDLYKENYYVPPLPDTELISYTCRETGYASVFTVAKNKLDSRNMEFVDRVKVTHAFLVDDEITYNVTVKITRNGGGGLSVEVEGPVKLTTDYTKQVVSKMGRTMQSQMEATKSLLLRNNGKDDRQLAFFKMTADELVAPDEK